MPPQSRLVSPGPHPRVVLGEQGEQLRVPADWELLSPGDAGLTRRVKSTSVTWTVREKVGRRMFSRGVWAPAAVIEAARAELATARADPAYARRLQTSRARRARQQEQYAEDFEAAVAAFLDFHPTHAALQAALANAVANHAVPVGSGTVARTQRIPLERRAEAATIAWLRHATTGYDGMVIARVKGERREVRRRLAQRSRQLLARYRAGEVIEPSSCLLRRGLEIASLDSQLDRWWFDP